MGVTILYYKGANPFSYVYCDSWNPKNTNTKIKIIHSMVQQGFEPPILQLVFGRRTTSLEQTRLIELFCIYLIMLHK